LQPGVRYKATARIPGSDPITKIVTIPRPDVRPTTVIQRVYPSGAVVPENQLKFYIHFSAPMSRGIAYDHISLLDETGAKVDRPFLEIGEELWDPDAVRFTLFFDPGRIKRGLVPHNEMGTPIHEGHTYTLVIDAGWPDAEGNPLAAEFRKTFKAGPPERELLDLRTWTVHPPESGTSEAVVVDFSRPLDHAILEHGLEIVDSAGVVVRGAASIGREEMQWKFTPADLWKAGSYSLRASDTLADLAGNMIDRPFEIDLTEKPDPAAVRPIHVIPFTIH
jgi:hypothetical protein